jgi:pyruvate-ferredoxin/flavodoxin oxidoreductase
LTSGQPPVRRTSSARPSRSCEMQSEAGASGTVHGSLAAGALTTTYTASQGLLLMIPNMYKIAAEQLPAVFHVSARTVATHALNIFGDHSDVMACRQTGFAMLCENNVAGGHGSVSRGPSGRHRGPRPVHQLLRRLPHLARDPEGRRVGLRRSEGNVQHGRRRAFRKHALNPEHPTMRGSHENGDIFFQHREACNEVLRQAPRRRGEVHGQDQRKAGHQL